MSSKLTYLNRGYNRVVGEIEEIFKVLMINQVIADIYDDYLENTTDGDKVAAAILVLASIYKTTEQAAVTDRGISEK